MGGLIDFVRVQVLVSSLESGTMELAIKAYRVRCGSRTAVNVKSVRSEDNYVRYVLTFPNADLVFKFGRFYESLRKREKLYV